MTDEFIVRDWATVQEYTGIGHSTVVIHTDER